MGNRRRKRKASSRTSRRSSTEAFTLSEEDRDLVNRFLGRLQSIPDIQAVVLFGSFARADADRRSDIDLLLVADIPNPGTLRRTVARIISELRPHREISPTLTNLRDLDSRFLRTVFAEGIVLQGKLVLTPDQLAVLPRVLVAYDLRGATPSRKVQISRLIHGAKFRKIVGGKPRTYQYSGLKGRYGAVSVAKSTILLKPDDAEGFIAELEKRGVPYTRWDIYF